MYVELMIALWGMQSQLLEVLDAVDRDHGMGLFVLSHLTTSLEFLEHTKPPSSCEEVHRLCIECQRLAIRALAIELDSRPVPTQLLGDYEEASARCANALETLKASLRA